ncbi:hypothetical protein [Segetibacter sp.]|uniref:hypothetical protein n=1 Tax=Segetibacter sp. TaxID=2231182 RepID=UPI002615E070|nr:hypothetical protein [Segetibacter sp.]MCW3079239.1 hypothetical protein [Segetibacter sp.]
MTSLGAIKRFTAGAIFITGTMACVSIPKATSSAIGFVTLHSYLLNPDVLWKDTTNYIFIRNSNEFNKKFHMTKSSPGTVIVPDFSSQSVIAIIMKPTERVISPGINKAEIMGNELRVYYTVTDTSSIKTYLQTPMVVAAVPKSTSVTQVSFFRGNFNEKTIAAGPEF